MERNARIWIATIRNCNYRRLAVGRLAALQSGAKTFFVESRKDIDIKFIENIIYSKEGNNKMDTYVNKKMNVLVPLAGADLDFQKKGMCSPNHS